MKGSSASILLIKFLSFIKGFDNKAPKRIENKKKDTEIEIIISMFIAISKDKMKRDETAETKRDCREKSIAEIS